MTKSTARSIAAVHFVHHHNKRQLDNMRLIGIIALTLAMVVSTMAQDYSQLFAGFGPYFRAAAPMRDPRSNTGPVLFPSGPPPNNADTSGVIVGASGFGFVPPNTGFYTYFF